MRSNDRTEGGVVVHDWRKDHSFRGGCVDDRERAGKHTVIDVTKRMGGIKEEENGAYVKVFTYMQWPRHHNFGRGNLSRYFTRGS